MAAARSRIRSAAPAGSTGAGQSNGVSRPPAAKALAVSARRVKFRPVRSKKPPRSMAAPSRLAGAAVMV